MVFVSRLGPAVAPSLLAGLAFLLAAHPVSDADVWWHLRAGAWILEHRAVPDRDPFTFGSAGERWVDLHWGFQVPLALAHRAGGVGGVVLLTGLLAAAAAAAGWFAAGGRASGTAALLIWAPCVVLMGTRFRPRPEMCTLLFLALFLAVLARVPSRPRLAWVLPAVQVVWVNTHGLFVLGPVVVGLWVADRLAARVWPSPGAGLPPPLERGWWGHVGGAAVLVGVACLANPYGVRGAAFPLVLYPKVTQAGNPYKEFIAEFETPSRAFARKPPTGPAATDLFCLRLMLLLVPLSFLVPAIWNAAPAAPVRGKSPPAPPSAPDGVGWAVLGGVLGVVALHAAGPLVAGPVPWLGVLASELPPPLLLVVGVVLAVRFSHRDRAAAVAAAAGFGGLAAWMMWLNDYWATGREAAAGGSPFGPAAAVAGAVTAVLYVRRGGSLFVLGLAVAFTYLALQAVNSVGRFGLVAGAVIVGNLGPWAARTLEAGSPVWSGRVWAGARAGFALALAAWVAAIAAGPAREWVGPLPPFGMREERNLFPHDACRFAGQDGMPDRALVYGIDVAGVYVYHNAPRRKPFIDPRMEVPTLETFIAHAVSENANGPTDPEWTRIVRQLNPGLALVSHTRPRLEATFLSHPDWRLVYLDGLATVFLRTGDAESAERFPTVDLVARHFDGHPPDAGGEGGERARREAVALGMIGADLAQFPGVDWGLRAGVSLAVLGRATPFVQDAPANVNVIRACGLAHFTLIPNLNDPRAAGWDPFTGVRWAAATYRFLQVARAPDEKGDGTATTLYEMYAARGMVDAQSTVGAKLLASPRLPPARVAEIERHVRAVPPPLSTPLPPGDRADLIARAVRAGYLETATLLAEDAPPGAWGWGVADPLAGAYMHLGRPDRARGVWAAAAGPPSEAGRAARVASTHWAEGDLGRAAELYREASAADPGAVEPAWGLAWVEAERGRAGAGVDACRRAVALGPPERVRGELENLQKMLERYAK